MRRSVYVTVGIHTPLDILLSNHDLYRDCMQAHSDILWTSFEEDVEYDFRLSLKDGAMSYVGNDNKNPCHSHWKRVYDSAPVKRMRQLEGLQPDSSGDAGGRVSNGRKTAELPCQNCRSPYNSNTICYTEVEAGMTKYNCESYHAEQSHCGIICCKPNIFPCDYISPNTTQCTNDVFTNAPRDLTCIEYKALVVYNQDTFSR